MGISGEAHCRKGESQAKAGGREALMFLSMVGRQAGSENIGQGQSGMRHAQDRTRS